MKTKVESENSVKHGIFNTISDEKLKLKLSTNYLFSNLLVSALLYCCILAVILFCIFAFTGCVSVAPVNSSFENAKTLGKGNYEIVGNYSTYSERVKFENGQRESAKTNNNFGFRVGIGLGEKVDLKFRYERLIPADKECKEEVSGVNYFVVTPKFSIYKKYIAGFTDVGLYTYRANDGSYSDQVFLLTPRMAFTYPSGKYFDLTLSPRLDIYFGGEMTINWGINLGCGLSSDLDKWAIRPEIGIMKGFEDRSFSYFTGGFALILKFNK